MKCHTVLLLCVSLIVLQFACITDESFADAPNIELFSIKLVDDDGNITDKFLSSSYTADTIHYKDYTVFNLKANASLQASPCNVLIESGDGEFNVNVTVTGLSSYLSESGIRIEMTDSDQKYVSDLTESNDFNHVYFIKDDSTRATLKPNVMYPISIMTLDDVEHEVAPEKVKDVVITFTAHLKSDLHQVAVINEGKVIDSYTVKTNEPIHPLPIVERDGYDFVGWFNVGTDKQVENGYIVTDADGNLIKIEARWTPISSSSGTNFNWIIPVIITAAILGLLLIFLVYRRRRSASA